MAVDKKNNIKDDQNIKDKNLSLVMGQIRKEFGNGSIMYLGDDTFHADIPTISTGALALDIALGIGGVPREDNRSLRSGSIR